MARALSHSDQTAELHYRAAEPEKKVEGFEVVGQLVGLPATLKVDPVPATRKRRKFTAEMTSLIQREFAEEIRTMRPPNKERAAAFLSENSELFEGKSSKDIWAVRCEKGPYALEQNCEKNAKINSNFLPRHCACVYKPRMT